MVFSAPKCGQACSQTGSREWCWGSGTPESWGSTPTLQTKGWRRRKRKFFSFLLRLEGHVRKQSAVCYQITPKLGLKARIFSPQVPAEGLHAHLSSFPLTPSAVDIYHLSHFRRLLQRPNWGCKSFCVSILPSDFCLFLYIELTEEHFGA